uniref:NADH-ubiquinone oxidoreductase chain 5 n=1 Tax=Pseudacysta perseae TaxID=1041453 RepID=A0A089QGX4_PSEPZ|nr:NADH dehydrogenase subunit 5 [Pseudacysta perseae]AIR11948.1 NADH dehydrogenase subunit 5 [Pseudacysta perseae]
MYIFIFLLMLFLSLLISYIGFMFLNYNYSMILEWEVFSLNSCSLYFTLYIDWMSLLFFSVVLMISSMVIFYSYDYMMYDNYSMRFLILVVTFVFSMMLLVFSLNMVSILLGWDGLGLVSYCLVIYYQNINSYSSGMLTILTNRLGDVFILISIGWFFNFGSFDFMMYLDFKYDWLHIFCILIILASFTKSAQIPFSSWLPAAMAAPTPVSSLVHSSTLVTAGVYLLIRFGNLIIYNELINLFFILSVLTMLMSGIGANFEMDLKKIVAFSTLSQLGLMMSILFMGDFILSYFHLLSHAFFKSLLFMCSGLIIHSMCDSQDIRYMGFVCKEKPYMTTCFLISNLSLCGLFFMSGFYSKDLIVESFLLSNYNFVMFFIYFLCVSLTVCYTFRLLYYVLFYNYSNLVMRSIGEGFSSYLSLIILVFFSIFFGSFFSWIIFYTPKINFFPFYMKIMILIFMVLGLLIFYFNFYLMNKKMNFLLTFFGTMWYLNWLGSFYMSNYTLKLSCFYKFVTDDSWGEYYFSSYISSILVLFSTKLNLMIFNNLKFYLLSFFMLMMYFIL